MFGNKMGAVDKAIQKRNVDGLMHMADSKERDVSLAALGGLGEVGGDKAGNYLISQLSNADPDRRIAAAHALGVFGDKHVKAFVKAQLAKETDERVKAALTKALAQIQNY